MSEDEFQLKELVKTIIDEIGGKKEVGEIILPHIAYCNKIQNIILQDNSATLITEFNTLHRAIGGLVIQLCAELYRLVDMGYIHETVADNIKDDFEDIMSGYNKDYNISVIKNLILLLDQIRRLLTC